MKVAVCSDLHLEFGPISLENTENADVLVLSGDICVANDLGEHDALNIMGENTRSNRFHKFFQECSERFPHVIYIMGNHEHYHGDFALSSAIIRDRLAHLRNFHFLDKEVFRIDDVTFIGGTLWTDMNKEDEMTLRYIARRMNDFQTVKNSNRKVTYKVPEYAKNEDGTTDYSKVLATHFKERDAGFCPEDAVEQHKETLKFLERFMTDNPNKKLVVVGHHAPSKTSTKPAYQGDYLMNGGYSSELTEFILNHNHQIKYWTHGHTHDDFDYMIGTTRVVCNPRGYIHYEARADYFELKYYEV